MKKKLPEDTKRFANVDVIFKDILKHFKGTPNCVASCNKDGLMKQLENVADDLELCEKAPTSLRRSARSFHVSTSSRR